MKRMAIYIIIIIMLTIVPNCYAEEYISENYDEQYNTEEYEEDNSYEENRGNNNVKNNTTNNNYNQNNNEVKHGTEKLVDIKKNSKKKLDDYKQEYGSDTYGIAAYIINIIRIYSIPFCFIGIAIGAIYQYVIGIHKLDERDKGFGMIISFVTILVIAQILPLVFVIVVKGWRG